ncbi:hypothetical protein PG994_000133 [Apiospora phragmitis]|uniref:Uncharacterized protein n=1 Tax=Apiospora phragmitis TaxID=2905665 RepID=A0ABR1X5G1_9PEZI
MSQRYFPTNDEMTSLMFRLNMLEPVALEVSISCLAEWSLLRQYSPALEETKCRSSMRLIRLVRDGLQRPGAVSDSTLVGMMALSWRPANCCPHAGPLRGLFRDVGIDRLGVHENLAHYELAEESWAAFLYCLNMRGGIENIDLHCGSESFTLADNIGLCRAFQHVFQTWLPQVRPPLTEAAAFPVDDGLKELLLDIRVCCQEIEEYVIRAKNLGDPGLTGMVVPYQNIVQHRLMSLRREEGSGGSAEDICRAAALVFTLGVTFPLPRAEPLASAAADLARIMHSSSNTVQNRRFLFWTAMLGAIAAGATESPAAATNEGNESAGLYMFFLDHTRRFRAELGLTTWDAAKAMLKTFLWLDRACDEGAWKVWSQTLRPSQAAVSKQATM